MKKSLFLLLGLVFPAGASVNQAGQLATRFGVNGSATFSISGRVVVFSNATIDSQQRIIVVGRISGIGALVARFLPTGQIDTSFNSVGYRTFFYNNTSDRAYGVSLFGDLIYVGACGASSSTFGFVVCLNSNGSLNQSWGTQGFYYFSTPAMEYLFDLQVQQDGKVLVCGARLSSTTGYLARINAAGTALDATFNATGTPGYHIIFNYACYDFVLANNGFIYVVASRSLESKVYTFTPAGVISTSTTLPDCQLLCIAMQSNGDLIVSGINLSNRIVVNRVTSAGLVQTSFGDTGALTSLNSGTPARVLVSIDDTFFVVYSGVDPSFVTYNYITSYDKNGLLVTSFGTGGTTRLNGITNTATAVVPDQDGTLIIAGYTLASSGIIQEYTQYDPGQVGFTNTGLSLVKNTAGGYAVAVNPEYRVPVTNQQLLPAYVRAGLTGF